MTLPNVFFAIGILMTILGGVWGTIKTLLARDRKSVEDQQKAMWKRLDEVRAELHEAMIEQARLKERVDGAPDWETRIQALETRLERKFDDLMGQFREIYAQAFAAFQQQKRS